ncbi:MAG: IPExxxVDY family protein [Bacteroidales bacterium]|nr:IPExxxVDY family protein [Bacteroidales bacterium]
MKIKKLKYKPEYNFKLIGISSAEDDYKLSWKLGQVLKTEFVRARPLQIIDPKYTDYQMFSVFESDGNNNLPDIRLITNKGNEGFLIEELKNIDFFIIIHYDELTENFDQKLMSKLKNEAEITAVFPLDPSRLKSKEKLLF